MYMGFCLYSAVMKLTDWGMAAIGQFVIQSSQEVGRLGGSVG